MSVFTCRLSWKRNTPDFTYDGYDRTHQIRFPGGIEYLASSAPEYKGNSQYINPEENLVAALSSCHMLTFLAIASRSRFTVDEYVDEPVGEMSKNEEGRLAVTKVVLKPKIKFSGERVPTPQDIEKMHHKSHENCFIANSVRTVVSVEL